MVLRLFALITLAFTITPTWAKAQRGYSVSTVAIHQLATHPQWLHLGYWTKSSLPLWGKSYTSPIRGNFFLAAQGADDPEQELVATLEAFAESRLIPTPEDAKELEHPLCRYQARWSFLKSQNIYSAAEVLAYETKIVDHCQKRTQWKKELSAKSVTLIYASSDIASPASSFGHTFLKIHSEKNSNRSELLDYAVNYSAVTDNSSPALYALKGLFGKYPGAYNMLPYHQKIQEYSSIEARELWEYPLVLTQQETTFLVDHLIELSGSWQPYYFLSENCANQILTLLNVVRPLEDLKIKTPWTIPIETAQQIDSQNLISGAHWRGSLLAELRLQYDQLSAQQKSAFAELQNQPQESLPDDRLLIEALLSYENLRVFKNEPQAKERLHRLALHRARLGASAQPRKLTPSVNPLLQPSSQSLGISLQTSSDATIQSLSYSPASHDELTPAYSHGRWTKLELAKLKIQRISSRKAAPSPPDRTQVDFTLIDILSTENKLTIQGKPSWRMKLGTAQQNLDAAVSYGLAADAFEDSLRLGLFTSLKTSQNYLQPLRYALHPSLDAVAWLEVLPRLKIHSEMAYLIVDDQNRTQVKLAAGWLISRDTEIRFYGVTDFSNRGFSNRDHMALELIWHP